MDKGVIKPARVRPPLPQLDPLPAAMHSATTDFIDAEKSFAYNMAEISCPASSGAPIELEPLKSGRALSMITVTKPAKSPKAGVKTPSRREAAREPTGRETIGTLMRVTLAKLREALQRRLALEAIPWSCWPFLRVLWDEDGITQRELTVRVGMRQPTTVTALQSMEKLGLVALERETEDRRKMRIHLTNRGRTLKNKLLPDIIALNDKVALNGFNERDITQFRCFLEQMYSNLSEHEEHTRESPMPTSRSKRKG